MEKPTLLDRAIAPLTWLERAKGPKRLGLVFLYAMIALVVGVLGWRGLSLWNLPDIGEPFDTARFGTVDVPDSSNAMIPYREAAAELIAALPSTYKVASSKSWENHNWATADPEVRRWVVDNRPAFAIWLQGTERPECLVGQPRDLSENSFSVIAISFQDFIRLARLEASRLEAEGDLEGAWRVHRASLRASRHVGMHGTLTQRMMGHGILRLVWPDVLRWVDDSQVTPELLRRAIADVEVCKAMTAPNSEMFRSGYFALSSVIELTGDSPRRAFDNSGESGDWLGYSAIWPQIRHFLRREPERTRRIHNLITAGILAQCDRPRGDRPMLASSRFMIYDIDPVKPGAVAAIEPGELAKWADRSLYADITGDLGFHFGRIETEVSIFDTFLLSMALRAYEIERGQSPKTYGELLGPYLKTLPEGFEPGDSIAPTTIPN
jgi:hypothetical protein